MRSSMRHLTKRCSMACVRFGGAGTRGEQFLQLGMRLFCAGLVLLLGGISGSGCTVRDLQYCTFDEECPGIIGPSDVPYFCDSTLHVCLRRDPNVCRQDEDCNSPAASRCDMETHRCAPCLLDDVRDTSCMHLGSTPYCASKTDGGTVCVACRQNLDCPASTPICEKATQLCRKCESHQDCEGTVNCDGGTPCTDSLVCIKDSDPGPELPGLAGRCAQNGGNGRVIYVYSDPSVCNDTHGGTDFAHPRCRLNYGYMATDQRRVYVRVVAATPYDAMNEMVQSGQVVFIGSPVDAYRIGSRARVDAILTTFAVSGSGNVTIDGFDLHETRSDRTIIQCSGTPPGNVPALTLRNSVVSGSTGSGDPHTAPAIDIANCQAKISGNVIGLRTLSEIQSGASSHSHGLRLASVNTATGASYFIENNLIAGNWGMPIDLDAVHQSTVVTVRFNTIVQNGRDPALPGYIRCPLSTGSQAFLGYSIVFGNGSSGVQIGSPANCSYKQVVVGPSQPKLGGADFIYADPKLDANFALTLDSSDCINRAQPSLTEAFPFPPVDLNGTPRPQDGFYDLGAFEFHR